MPTQEITVTDEVQAKLKIIQQKLGVSDTDEALNKILDIANYITDTVNDPASKLLVEREGKFKQLYKIA
jgi:hypothetical protein